MDRLNKLHDMAMLYHKWVKRILLILLALSSGYYGYKKGYTQGITDQFEYTAAQLNAKPKENS